MKVSYKWLQSYFTKDLPPAGAVAGYLNLLGLEVEDISEYNSAPEGMENLITGRVLTCEPHPNADRLKITTVDTGAEEPLHIVCGAPNVAQGQNVIVAPIGTTIHPVNGDALTIKKVKIRGERSEGMICSEDEIGLGTSHEGIIVLEGDVEPGTAAADIYDFYSDTVFDIDLTPNRADATHHRGVAKDLYGYLKFHNLYDGEFRERNYQAIQVPGSNFSIQIKDQKACPRYSAMVVEGLKVTESPKWIRDRLSAIGIRPINNIVDATNFISHDIGQPLHAFDLDKLDAPSIRVRKANSGEIIETLDKKERKLEEQDLLICTGKETPVAIAGVFGGSGTGVDENTTRILLESAHFDPTTIRKTSMSHNLRTEAARIYEKGSDPSITIEALKGAYELLSESNELASVYIDEVDNTTEKEERIPLRLNRINAILGIEMTAQEVERILELTDLEFSRENETTWSVTKPSSKPDVVREIDLIEEIFRIYGVDKVDVELARSDYTETGKYPDKYDLKNRLSDLLSGRGYFQVMNLSLTRNEPLTEKDQLIKIHNTSNRLLDTLRPSLIYSMLETIAYNIRYNNSDLKIFEWGRTYYKKGKGKYEEEYLAMALTGNRAGNWHKKGEPVSFFDLKGDVEWLLHTLHKKQNNDGHIAKGQPDQKQKAYPGEEKINMEKGTGIGLLHQGGQVGRIFKVKKPLLESYEIEQPVYYAELKSSFLYEDADKPVRFKPLNKIPVVDRDLSLEIDKQISWQALKSMIEGENIKWLKEVSLFDVYESEELEKKNKKVYGVSLIFSHKETLTDEKVDQQINRIVKLLREQTGAELR